MSPHILEEEEVKADISIAISSKKAETLINYQMSYGT